MIATVSCLVCDTALEVAEATEKGEIVECGSCGQEHEVVGAADGRFTVEFAPEVEEDWGE
ncbi:lysine biosynthesis protein LysW [Saccharothrix deserti]|uniref:lysine biosynthesis protein LysW n=1 Tax=Saccharothrix deserti TaxID=2593674 RepID=UPI00131D1FB9|nr:lysine biosynthesis protein LysW [Saccharothrix deserti]